MSQPVSWGRPAERADAARNRRLLLAAARVMLAEQGPDRLTMDGLAGVLLRIFAYGSAGSPAPGCVLYSHSALTVLIDASNYHPLSL
jgi:hypothetical protein